MHTIPNATQSYCGLFEHKRETSTNHNKPISNGKNNAISD